jgi:hypothetical protein
MFMPNKIYNFFAPTALHKNEETSDKRSVFIDQSVVVNLRFEFETEEAFKLFHQLPAKLLPQLPKGYQWVKSSGKYGMMRHQDAVEHEMEVIIYGPDEKHHINFLCRQDDVTFYSFANTQKIAKVPAQRKYPISSEHYGVIDFDYSQTRYKHHIRGHLIDHFDTIGRSSLDWRNYTPEAPMYEWGMGIRRLVTAELRTAEFGGAYAQYNHYGINPSKTLNGTPVSDTVRFFTYHLNVVKDKEKRHEQYKAQDLFHISFSENLASPAKVKILDYARDNFCSDFESAPIIKAYEPELSDRDLRKRGRDMLLQALRVSNGNSASRFVEQDFYDLSCITGDYEFEQFSRRLSAGILSYEKNYTLHAVNYCKSSLNYAEALIELDLPEPSAIIEDTVRFEAHSFFQNADDDGMLALADQFQRICSDIGPD